MMGFASQLKKWRVARGITQEVLAKRSGMGRPNLIDLELGRRDCTLKTLEKLAQALQITPGILLDKTPSHSPPLDRYQKDKIARALVSPETKLSPSLKKIKFQIQPLVFPILRAAGITQKSKGKIKLTKAHAEALLGREVVKHIVQRVNKIVASRL